MITKSEHKIVSRYLYNLIDWERIYDESPSVSRKKFTKEDILNTIQNLVLKYPDSFDTSIENRIESCTSVFNVKVGIINDYMYIISDGPRYIGSTGWFLTDDYFNTIINNHIENGGYCVVINIKNYLRKDKIKKLKINIKPTEYVKI